MGKPNFLLFGIGIFLGVLSASFGFMLLQASSPVSEDGVDIATVNALSVSDVQLSAEVTNENSVRLYWQGAAPDVDVSRIAWFYKPPGDGDIQTIADHFDTFILTKRDETVREALRDLGKDPFLQYIRFDAIHDPCKQILNDIGSTCQCDQPTFANNVGWQEGDICRLRDEHPDWFLRDQAGTPIIYEDYAYMDPGAEGWRNFWLERIREMQAEGWDGVFLDNLDASQRRHTRQGVTLANYASDTEFRQAFQGFLMYIVSSYFEPAGRPVYANVTEFPDYEAVNDFTPYLDGMMNEAWAVGWNENWRSVEEWEADLQAAQELQAAGKHLILVSQGMPNNLQRQSFAYGSYLLIANDHASFRYAHSSIYNTTSLYPNYQINLGQPLGERYPVGRGWQRDFSHGQVFVDPYELTAVIRPLQPLHQLERSIDGGQTYEVLSLLPNEVTSYTDTQLDSNYCYRLAHQQSDAVVYSNAICIS